MAHLLSHDCLLINSQSSNFHQIYDRRKNGKLNQSKVDLLRVFNFTDKADDVSGETGDDIGSSSI